MGKNYFITKSKNFPHLADLCSKNDENTIEKQVINPFAVARTKAKEMGYSDFSEGSPGRKKASEIAEAIKEKEGIQKSDFGKYLKELNKYNGKKK